MNRTRILSILGTVVLTGVAVLVGIYLGDAADDRPVLPSATPAPQAPVAASADDPFTVVDADGEPVDGGPAPIDPSPDGERPGGGAGALPPVPSGAPAVSDETAALLALVEDIDEQAAAVAAGEAEPEAFEPPTDDSGVTPDSPSLHTPSPDELLPEREGERPDFVDLCAGPTPGEGPPPEYECPEDGVAGTVIALIADPSSALGIELEPIVVAVGPEARRNENPSQGESWGYCDYSSVPEGEVPIYLLYTRPVEAVVDVNVLGIGGEGGLGVTEHTLEGATPEARLENIAMMMEAMPEPMDPRFARAQVCLSTPAPSEPQFGLVITATDSDGNERTDEVFVDVAGTRRDFTEPPPPADPPPPPPPPVREAEILTYDATHARIVAPQGDPARERVHIAVVAVSGTADAGTETCGSIQQSVFDGSRVDRRLYNWEVTPRIPISSFDPMERVYDLFGIENPGPEAFDPNEGLEHQTLVWLLGEDGATYDVCVWWTGNPTTPGQFATPPIVEQRRYRVEAGDRYTVTAELVDLYLYRPAGADQFTVQVLGRRGSFPATDLPGSALTDGGSYISSIDEPITIGSATGDLPYLSTLRVTNTATETSWEVQVPTRASGCDGSDEGICLSGHSHTHWVDLPGVGAQPTTCLGQPGCPLWLPTDQTAGMARIRISYSDPDGGAEPTSRTATWRTAERADFRGDPPVLPTTPRLDRVRTELQDPIGGFAMPSTSIRGQVWFDRPVTGEIRVDAVISEDNVACDRDPVVIGPEPQQFVNLNLTGLCRDAIYSFPATVVDADGNTAEIAGTAPLAGFTRVLNVRWSMDVEITEVHTGDGVTLESGTLTFDDKAHSSGDDRCIGAGYHVATPPHTTYSPREDSLLGPDFTVGAELTVQEGCGGGAATRHTERWETELSTDLLEALFFSAGRTQTVEVEVTGPVVDYTVRIRIEHIDRVTCTGGTCSDRA